MTLVGCGGTLPPEVALAYDNVPENIDFNFHVKPILSDRCYTCHGPDNNARKAEFRLDTESGAFSGLATGGHAFLAGNLKKSKAITRILSDDPEFMMPPPESNLHLNSREKAIIAKWVEQGAQWKDHWSFIPPVKTALPTIADGSWRINNSIDNFILGRLESEGLEPSDPAPKATLLRRVSLDLTGLPPSVADLELFLKDESADAYEKVVDRLLSAKHYGERMAIDWLDVARYADSHGYQDDGMRNAWPWRDWVINAYNTNMPYDQFLIWQLAGDLLPDPTKEQLIATCFNRNHPQTQEGGVVDEEYRVEYVADRTNTFGKALLGLTMECARCHDHKYDPITQKEYYSLYAYFNNNHDTGIIPYNGEASPTLILPSEEAEGQLIELRKEIARQEAALASDQYLEQVKQWIQVKQNADNSLTKGLKAEFNFDHQFEVDDGSVNLDKSPAKKDGVYKANFAYRNLAKNQLDAKVYGDMDSRPLMVEGRRGMGLKFRGDAGIRFNHDLEFERNQPFTVSIWVKLLSEGESGPIFNKSNGEFEGYRGWLCKLNKDGTISFQLNHVWPANCIDIKTKEKLPVGKWTHLVMAYDGSSKASGLRVYIDGRIPDHQVITDNLNKSILHGINASNWNYMPVLLGMEFRSTIVDIVMDDFKIYDRELSSVEISALHEDLPVDLSSANERQLQEYYLLTGKDSEYQQTLNNLTRLRGQENLMITDQPEVMIMKERPVMRTTYLLERGMYDAHGEEVSPGTPEVFPEIDQDFSADRLGLANWLVHPDHPLSARVAVNRLWTQCFGAGLVATQEDFGNQGNLPTHPELLDWLAVDLIEKKWDVKASLKQIVMSATYKQSSIPSQEAAERDAENVYYSYYPFHRLSAEVIRDQALSVSGLLVPVVGGPSVYPYQPKGIWKALATRNATEYIQQHGDSLYRRSMYTVWKRSSPPPAMMNFDAPDRYYCVVRRQQTSTPLQSLVLMNDPQFVEAARICGERIIRESGSDLDERIDFAFKMLVGRNPRIDEKNKMISLYQEELNAFKHNPKRATELLNVGEYPLDQTLDQTELAAFSILASTLMNFDEFVIKR
ncbi:MAG: endo-inulinase [Cyclobacteriaceae bacterium]|nr:MAG: endo-inulinase [Cyclobacteriaceae bacterium]